MFLAGQTPMMWGVREALAKGGNEVRTAPAALAARARTALA